MSTDKRRSQRGKRPAQQSLAPARDARTPGKRPAQESLAPARAKRSKKKDSPKDDKTYEDLTSDEELANKRKRPAQESLAPARNAKRSKKKDSPKDDKTYEDLTSDEELASKRAAWMEHLDRANTKFRDGLQVLPTWFEFFFEALEAKDQDSLWKALEDIAEEFAIMRKQIEQMTDKLRQTADDFESLAKLRLAKKLIERLQEDWEAALLDICKPLAPSAFAKSSAWARAQIGPAAIDCLRPFNRSGLPISLLHPAFAKFKLILTQPMPSNENAIKATAIAWRLCTTMPDHFKDKDSRRTDLVEGLSPLFPGQVISKDSFGSANPDGVIAEHGGSINAVIELKNEPGACGDVYMQCARSFDAAATVQLRKGASTSYSSFVICIDGPSILFCGGFKDQHASVVGPLSQWCSMLHDDLGERQEVLAKHLYALQVTLGQLKASPPGKVSRCPRIYDQFQRKDGNNQPLEFMAPFKPLGSHCPLLFKAKTTTSESEEEVVVKVVREGYGKDAHYVAAESGFAPKLYGVAKVDGAPPAYVMELLSEEQGWVLLQHTYSNVKARWEKLEGELDKFLDFLRANDLVHGDLRGNNVLCHMRTDDVKIRVIDWDWAGKSGIARYPLTRNPAANLPANPGDLISFDHDSSVLKKYFNDRKKVS